MMLIGFQRTKRPFVGRTNIHSDNKFKTVEINYIMKLTLFTKNSTIFY